MERKNKWVEDSGDVGEPFQMTTEVAEKCVSVRCCLDFRGVTEIEDKVVYFSAIEKKTPLHIRAAQKLR